jgi:hypothetical protein
LLARLKKLAAAGKPLTLRALTQEPYNISPIDIYLLAESYPEVEIIGDGKEHKIVFRPVQSARRALTQLAGPPRSGPSPTRVEIDELPLPAPTPGPAEIPAPEPAEIPEAAASEIPADYHEKMLAELRGDRRIGSRYGGAPTSMRARAR